MSRSALFKPFARFFPGAKSRLRNLTRNFLVRRGLVLFRAPAHTGLPPSLVEYLQALTARGRAVDTVFSFDDEPEIQKELLGVFPAQRVLFAARPSPQQETPGFPPTTSLKPPGKPFLVEIDGETFDLPALTTDLPWLLAAEAILIRATLGHFWSGNGDLCRMVQFMEKNGFVFRDALEYFKLHLLNAPLGRMVFIFENQKLRSGPAKSSGRPEARDEAGRIGRINEALASLSNPIARSSAMVRLTGRGSLGFAAGVLNPGAIVVGDKTILLARGEHIPWAISKHNLSDFLGGCRPVLFELDEKQAVIKTEAAAFTDLNDTRAARLEDFRLFRHENQLYSNHSRFTPVSEIANGEVKPVEFKTHASRISVGISRLDLAARQLTFLGSPTVDFPTGPAEKNWAVFGHETQLYIIYSFNPFHLLQASQWPQLDFKTVLRKKLILPHDDSQLPFRNSANPVEYDGSFLLHMVHKVYPGKQYAFWAVLIEKSSRLPKMISARPLVCGWKSSPASIVYACSLVVHEAEVIIFSGLNDSGLGYWKISRSVLDESWVSIAI